jgi:thioredoxin reductase (NADPH)
MSTSTPSQDSPLVVYGASWCPDCRRAKQFLTSHRIPFTWIDLETEPDQVAEVESRNDGKRIIPTIVFPDGSFLAEPSNDELADRSDSRAPPRSPTYDLVIVGGGPTGLTTAIYGARENAKVLIVEKSAPGGQAGITERFDNYPGFPDGVGGAELAERMTRQARTTASRFSRPSARPRSRARTRCFASNSRRATSSRRPPSDCLGLDLPTHRRRGRGRPHRRGHPLLRTCDGPFYKGAKDLTIVGGGNSGLEEGLFLTQFADCVTVVQALPNLTGNKLLQEKVLNHPKMDVLVSAVKSFNANDEGKLQWNRLTIDGKEIDLETNGAFIFIGLDPNTDFLDGLVDVDARGFIVTDHMFNTNVEGIFAAGDVRSGSTKQIASAVGEGAAAAIQIRYFLEKFQESVEMHS